MAAEITFQRGQVFVKVYGDKFLIRREYYPPNASKDYSDYLELKDIKNLRFVIDRLEAMHRANKEK